MCTITTSLISWLAWIFAIAVFAAAKKRIEKASSGELSVKLGNCVWMSLCAAVSGRDPIFERGLLIFFLYLTIVDSAFDCDMHKLRRCSRAVRFEEKEPLEAF